jgi:hypothetical protein
MIILDSDPELPVAGIAEALTEDVRTVLAVGDEIDILSAGAGQCHPARLDRRKKRPRDGDIPVVIDIDVVGELPFMVAKTPAPDMTDTIGASGEYRS